MTDLTPDQKAALLKFHNKKANINDVLIPFGLEPSKANRAKIYDVYKAEIKSILLEPEPPTFRVKISDETLAQLVDAEEPLVVEQTDYDLDVARHLAGDEDGDMPIKTLLVAPDVLPPVSITTSQVAGAIKEAYIWIQPVFDAETNTVGVRFEKRAKKEDCGC